MFRRIDLLDPLYEKYLVGSCEIEYLDLKEKLDSVSNEEFFSNEDHLADLSRLNDLENKVLLNGFWETAKSNLETGKKISEEDKARVEKETGVVLHSNQIEFLYSNDKSFYFNIPEELLYAEEVDSIIEYVVLVIEDAIPKIEEEQLNFIRKLVNSPLNVYAPFHEGGNYYERFYTIVGKLERELDNLQWEALDFKEEEYLDNLDFFKKLVDKRKEIKEAGFWVKANKNMKEDKIISAEDKKIVDSATGVKIVTSFAAFMYKDKYYHVPEALYYSEDIEEIVKYIKTYIRNIN